jgi:hypothetical protein
MPAAELRKLLYATYVAPAGSWPAPREEAAA